MEHNYDFRARHWQVHRPDRRNPARTASADELMLDAGWRLGGEGGEVLSNALRDFQDYLWVSMALSLPMTNRCGEKTIWFRVDPTLARGFRLDVAPDHVLVTLCADSEAFRASVYLEDLMNLEQAPVLSLGTTVRRPLFDYRSVHSGCGLDEYPDAELLATVHAGYDSIVLFVKDFDRTTAGYCNIADVIRRAKRFGILVFLYNYIPAFIHPDDPNAEQVFDATFGELFRRYPDAAGLSLCGESLEFPSRDPNTTGKLYSQSMTDGIRDTRPSPGWYPCSDYPDYLAAIERAVHRVKPDAILTFSTYNWAYETPEKREAFLKRLPRGYTLKVCYENMTQRTLEGLRTPVMDYTMSVSLPGEYFKTECAMAKKLGIPVQGNVNTTGIAWDFGCVPYVPAPYKLLERLRYLRRAHDELNVSSQYATHHYGWWSCVASDLGKWFSWEDYEPDGEQLLEKIAIRDYGRAAAPAVLRTWKLWSNAMNHYIASNEDQYGPWRVGAAYPFIFQPNITRTMLPKEIQFPTAPQAHFGWRIIKTLYQPYENSNQAPAFLRFPAELRELRRMETAWMEGAQQLDSIPDSPEAERLTALGQFILCSIRTVIHIKTWWILNMQLQLSPSSQAALDRLDEIERLAHDELANAAAALPAVRLDSRLGWEPSMEYVCDEWHLDWKRRQLESTLDEIAQYRDIIRNACQR